MSTFGRRLTVALNTMELYGSTAMAAFYLSQEKVKDKSARRMYYGCVFKAKKEKPVLVWRSNPETVGSNNVKR